ncbi:IS630 family transposase, partial [Paenibacillus sp. YN15]|uniref:IS630 family transposase n=1 Tax=Paenibacillus sp. YN15 TaxID=1742774 RepID=UPI000DCEB979
YHADLPDDVALVGIDEKTGMQANEKKYDTQLPTPRKRGRVEFEYIRHGTQTLFGAFDIQTGEVTASCGKGRTATDLEAFMEQLAERYRHCRTIIVIWDNLNIHHEGPSERWKRFNARHGNKFEFHYTPIHASWVNQIEIFFSILGKRVLRHGSFVSKADLKRKVMSFITRWNTQDKHPFHWRFKGYSVSGQEVA